MQLITDGVVIRDINYRESDKILTLLTEKYGKLTVSAKGARRLKSSLLALGRPFTYASFTLFKNKDRYILNDGEIKDSFFDLQKDLLKLSLANYFLELVADFTEEELPDDGVLRLLLTALFNLCYKDTDIKIVKSSFEIKILALTGYSPDLSGCTCGKPGNYFDFVGGCLLCSDCCNANSKEMTKSIFDAFKFICNNDVAKIFNFTLSEDSKHTLSLFSEKFLLTHAHKKEYHTLNFLKSLY